MNLKNRTQLNDLTNNDASRIAVTSNESTQKNSNRDLIAGELGSQSLGLVGAGIVVEDIKMTAIAVQLVDIPATQNLLITSDQALITACPDLIIAPQIVSADIAIAIVPLSAVNFDSDIHQEQPQAIVETLITDEPTRKGTDQSLWAMVQDTIAVVSSIP